ncbi:hypothetical protein BaRGS_00024606, partial [Batillaria attramentaria]
MKTNQGTTCKTKHKACDYRSSLQLERGLQPASCPTYISTLSTSRRMGQRVGLLVLHVR